MQNSFSLNDLYTRYAAGLLKKKEFEGAIFKSIQENVRRFGLVGWNKEDSDDYISSLYQRISQAISAYQETGSSFETYIGAMVRLTAKEFRSRQMRGYLEEDAAWLTQLPDIYACESELEYHDHITPETEAPIKLNNPRQLLILILKCCSHVSTDFMEKVSPQLGIEAKVLGEMIDYLKEQRKKREMEIATLREKINRQFYHCILLEKKLQVITGDSAVAQRLKNQLEQGRDKLSKIRKRLTRRRIDPSNFQIAKLLGISKGTVDSVLYNLRRRNALCLYNDQKNIEWTEGKTPHF